MDGVGYLLRGNTYEVVHEEVVGRLTEPICGRYRKAGRRAKTVTLGQSFQSTLFRPCVAALLLRGNGLKNYQVGPAGSVMRAVKGRQRRGGRKMPRCSGWR